MSSPRTGILSLIRFDLGWVESWVWWWRMLQILWRNLNNLWSGLGGYTLWGSEEWSGESRLKGLVVEEVANSVISEEVVQFIWVVGGWWRRLYNSFELGVGGGGGYTPCGGGYTLLWRRLYTLWRRLFTLLWFWSQPKVQILLFFFLFDFYLTLEPVGTRIWTRAWQY